MFRSLFGVFKPKVAPPSARRLFYCYQNDCLDQPRPLEEMEFGCSKCESPRPVHHDLPEAQRQRLPADLDSIWRRQVKCFHHHAYNVIPYCPVCRSPIFERAFDPPIGFWGGGNSGKTVFCAVLAREIQTTLFHATGLGNQFLMDRNSYQKEIVDKLFDDGILPSKTRYANYRKLVLRLYGRRWPDRVLTLTDMAGELYWERQRNLAQPDTLMARQQRMMLLARDAIFLLDPETSKQLGSATRPDLYPVLDDLLGTLQDLDERPIAESTARALIRRWQEILRSSEFPHNPGTDPPFSGLAEEIAGQVPGVGGPPNSLADEIRQVLEAAREDLVSDPDPEEVLEEIVNFIQLEGGGRLEEQRLAVTVTKTDSLSGDIFRNLERRYREILNRKGAPSRWTVRQWKPVLDEISRVSREVLVESGMGTFVERIGEQFKEVGFFFVSSLGRTTEPFIQRGMRITREATPRSYEGWVLHKRLTKEAPTGSPAPQPRFVSLPMLWLLTRDDG